MFLPEHAWFITSQPRCQSSARVCPYIVIRRFSTCKLFCLRSKTSFTYLQAFHPSFYCVSSCLYMSLIRTNLDSLRPLMKNRDLEESALMETNFKDTWTWHRSMIKKMTWWVSYFEHILGMIILRALLFLPQWSVTYWRVQEVPAAHSRWSDSCDERPLLCDMSSPQRPLHIDGATIVELLWLSG